jgi:hypothetical protein
MFVSVKFLHQYLGVDEYLAHFFVDRKVPEDNLFWQNRLLYVANGNGYTFIPVYYGLLSQLGIPQEILLSEDHLGFMERIMHLATAVERGQLSFADHLKQIAQLIVGRIKNQEFYDELLTYLTQPKIMATGRLGMQVPALNRADAFLFVLCDLPLSTVQMSRSLRYWYALLSSYLLMDDIYDYKMDKQDQEESSIVELGDGDRGFERAFELLDSNRQILAEINPPLSSYLERKIEELQEVTLKN